MCADDYPDGVPEPPQLPLPGTLMVDLVRDRVGEFRGEECGRWFLRPMGGGVEWTADPADVRPANPEQRIRAKTARANARSRGEVL
ncbi:hypothetical protein NX801_02800 [Streptomyces sp. LP05-1]|uniref:Uncharacterized protein n=1 Tax=Streptomyces pyxinae TaxID=2970734 RepID=A0ABT2CBX2_9ACTN|nr:hypothetical protein [Streptomyces sp. LP05-1]MCS0634607.1 hypothetical protein [Streptomyces sp. LP05-1]